LSCEEVRVELKIFLPSWDRFHGNSVVKKDEKKREVEKKKMKKMKKKMSSLD
jgi:hypothetical protein